MRKQKRLEKMEQLRTALVEAIGRCKPKLHSREVATVLGALAHQCHDRRGIPMDILHHWEAKTMTLHISAKEVDQ
jgi:hypothetical protein